MIRNSNVLTYYVWVSAWEFIRQNTTHRRRNACSLQDNGPSGAVEHVFSWNFFYIQFACYWVFVVMENKLSLTLSLQWCSQLEEHGCMSPVVDKEFVQIIVGLNSTDYVIIWQNVFVIKPCISDVVYSSALSQRCVFLHNAFLYIKFVFAWCLYVVNCYHDLVN